MFIKIDVGFSKTLNLSQKNFTPIIRSFGKTQAFEFRLHKHEKRPARDALHDLTPSKPKNLKQRSFTK